MSRRALAACLAAGLILIPTAASASEFVSGSDLKRYCGAFVAERQSLDAAFCLVFVQGFVSGANAADEIAGQRATARGAAQEETFAEKAARTRLGEARLRQARVARFGAYCLDEALCTLEIVEKIAAFIKDQADASELSAGEMIHRALVHHFPCDS